MFGTLLRVGRGSTPAGRMTIQSSIARGSSSLRVTSGVKPQTLDESFRVVNRQLSTLVQTTTQAEPIANSSIVSVYYGSRIEYPTREQFIKQLKKCAIEPTFEENISKRLEIIKKLGIHKVRALFNNEKDFLTAMLTYLPSKTLYEFLNTQNYFDTLSSIESLLCYIGYSEVQFSINAFLKLYPFPKLTQTQATFQTSALALISLGLSIFGMKGAYDATAAEKVPSKAPNAQGNRI